MLSPGHSLLQVFANSGATEIRQSGFYSQLRVDCWGCQEPLSHNTCQEHAGVVCFMDSYNKYIG